MVRKILAVIFSLCMALAVAPVVRAEETEVQEIKTADNLYNLFRTGGSGMLMNEILSSTYSAMSVLKNTNLNMNNFTINVNGITIESNVTLTLTGNGEVKSTGTIAVNSGGELHADNSVAFSTNDYVFVNLKDGTLNGGTYKMRVQGTGNEDTIQNGVFSGNIENYYGSIIIHNGTFTNNKIYVDQGQRGSITIKDGTFNSGSSIENSTINGGTFNAGSTISNSVINGGTFYGTIDDRCTVNESANVTVTFDNNNGSAVQAKTVLNGQPVTAPESPTKDGYTFAGWQLNNAAYDFSTPVTENLNLTAVWNAVVKDIGTFTIDDTPDQTYTRAAAVSTEPTEMNITLQPKGTQKILPDGTIQTSLGDGTYYDQNYIVWDGFGNKVGTFDVNTGNVIPIGNNATPETTARELVPNTGSQGIMGNIVSLMVSTAVVIGAVCVLKKY